jgi:hypothetical protein
VADIVIRGGDTELAVREMRAAAHEIFAFDPIPTTIGSGGHAAGTRSGVELAVMIALGLTPAIHAAKELAVHGKFGEQLRRLTRKAEAQRKATGATILIDPGDGKHIPLTEANRETILAALAHIEQRLKS